MKTLVAISLALAFATGAFAAETLSLNDDGMIVFSADTAISASGLNIESVSGALVPIPPGDLTASAAPFSFLLANNANQVTYGNLGSAVAIDGDLVTAVGYSGDTANFALDVSGAWGDGATQVSAVVAPAVPEPASGILVGLGSLGLLGFRRRR